jgi:hypothetical protein
MITFALVAGNRWYHSFGSKRRFGDSRAVTFHKKQLHNDQCICIQIKSNGIIAAKNSPIVFSLAELRRYYGAQLQALGQR